MDVWWLRVPRRADEHVDKIEARFLDDVVAVSSVRHDYHQVAYMVPAGIGAERRASMDIADLRRDLGRLFGWDEAQLAGLTHWDQVKSLHPSAGMLKRWSAPGVLCIGDAAHPMSPFQGVGVNLAIQDAVATARILGPILRKGEVPDEADLPRVERRRRRPTGMIRRMQDLEHTTLIEPALAGRISGRPIPLGFRLMDALPRLRGLMAWAQSSLLGRESTPDFARR